MQFEMIPAYRAYAELEQTHSKDVITFKSMKDLKDYNLNADAMITDMPGIALVIRTADCYPILFWDSINKVVGAAHSGREGTRKNIAAEVIKAMTAIGAKIDNIYTAIGPGISTEHYQVDETTWQSFCNTTGIEQKFRYIDIRKVIGIQLLEAGIKKEHIHQQQICTYLDKNYYSYRRDKTKGRQYSHIIITQQACHIQNS